MTTWKDNTYTVIVNDFGCVGAGVSEREAKHLMLLANWLTRECWAYSQTGQAVTCVGKSLVPTFVMSSRKREDLPTTAMARDNFLRTAIRTGTWERVRAYTTFTGVEVREVLGKMELLVPND